MLPGTSSRIHAVCVLTSRTQMHSRLVAQGNVVVQVLRVLNPALHPMFPGAFDEEEPVCVGGFYEWPCSQLKFMKNEWNFVGVCSTWIPVCFLGGYKVRHCFGNNQFLVIVIVVTILIIDIVIQEASIMAYLRTLCCRYLVNTNALQNFCYKYIFPFRNTWYIFIRAIIVTITFDHIQ